MLDQDNKLNQISLSVLICLLDNVWMLKGDVTCSSLLGVSGLNLSWSITSDSVGTVSSFVVTKSWCEQSVCFFPSRRSLVS